MNETVAIPAGKPSEPGRGEREAVERNIVRTRSGKIKIKGKEVHIKSPRQAIKHGIAFLTEDRKGQGLVLAQTIRTNLILANMKGFSSGLFLNEKKILETGEQNIASLRIKTPSIDEIVGQLSGGNQQKVVIGKWVNTDAEIFIFDEPTRGIDVGAKVEVYNVMNSLVKESLAFHRTAAYYEKCFLSLQILQFFQTSFSMINVSR